MRAVENYSRIHGSRNTCIPENQYQNLTLIKMAISESYSPLKVFEFQ